ncbi:hypothetical protein DFJ74DRAFT_689139 [Hyaloraphidium curvatum]|nr:hypothetical protein DFJ74DRAFT_689139 [Hyaloraphidium curvatum]
MALGSEGPEVERMPAAGEKGLRARAGGRRAPGDTAPVGDAAGATGNGHAPSSGRHVPRDASGTNARTLALGLEPWPFSRYLRWEFALGVALTLNFAAFWAVPIVLQGQLWILVLRPLLMPLFDAVDKNPAVRRFAETYVYSKPRHADYFVTLVLVVVTTVTSFAAMLYLQRTRGYLPWWSLFLHYCAWVGLGGRMMGAAYSFAHREGHNRTLYQRWIRESVGNICENWLGLLYGNVPYNFTTSHIAIHHKTNASAPDTFYMWDWPRDSPKGFMFFVTRVFLHMTGYSSLRVFKANRMQLHYDKLLTGMVIYFVATPVALYLASGFSASFVFWIWFQPLCCMSYFLAFINIGFHAFLEYDDEGRHIPCINSSDIIGGDDDFFGENNHMAHHYSTTTYWSDLPEWDAKQLEEWKRHRASVFRDVSIVEISALILLGQWDRVVDKFVDHSGGSMSREDIADMLRTRARRIEYRYEDYIRGPAANPIIRKGNFVEGNSEETGGL